MISLVRSNLNFEREPLAAPWGFKGGFLTEIWQTVARLESAGGGRGIGLGVQSVLWSDPRVFAGNTEAAGNCLMLLLTAYALREAMIAPFEHPITLLERLLPRVHDYGRQITGRPDLRLTFALNALVPVDNAAWLLYAAENQLDAFDSLIPDMARPALSHRHKKIVSVPAVGYAMRVEEMVRLADQGHFVFKIKLGCDPEQDGDLEKMLAWDSARIRCVHAALQDMRTSGTPDGRLLYYLDANGRYDSKERLLRLLDACADCGALGRTILLEEPFPEELLCSVGDLPVRVAADESANTEQDTAERLRMGYRAIAVKPAAKTLSMSFKMARAAHEAGVPCFCADLTVNPVLVDWNKVFGAHLAPLPGMEDGILETNGGQNYRDWSRLRSYHPFSEAAWTRDTGGLFVLDEEFYARSGGIFVPGAHYAALV